tara:strand:+ start:133 stop:309 length:177 start_codon:yes stop_codon:yes gene_type:complete
MDRLWGTAELGITAPIHPNSMVKSLDAEMELRGTEKAERRRDWLEKWLKGYALFCAKL